MDRIVVGVDPNTTEGKTAHACGIVVVGKRAGKHYVLDDYTLVGVKPLRWAMQIMNAVIDYDADEIVAETNQGGDMIRTVVEQAASEMEVRMPRFHKEHTRKGKARRAEPVATAYERGEVFHVGTKGSEAAPGIFYRLEEQMETIHEETDLTGEDFDRCDALVYGVTRLGVKKKSIGASSGSLVGFKSFGDFVPNGQTLQ
jgi:phage terminase large subunit-like protein